MLQEPSFTDNLMETTIFKINEDTNSKHATPSDENRQHFYPPAFIQYSQVQVNKEGDHVQPINLTPSIISCTPKL